MNMSQKTHDNARLFKCFDDFWVLFILATFGGILESVIDTSKIQSLNVYIPEIHT